MGVLAGADAMGDPEVFTVGVEGGVALALEGGLAGGLPEEEAGFLEPAAQGGLFRAALGVGEAGERGDAVGDERGVGYEDHVRRTRTGVKQADVSDALELAVEIAPLKEGIVTGGTVEVAAIQGLMT